MARIPAIVSRAVATLFLAGLSAVAATVFTVGDSAGWDISADLTSWPSAETFYVGDTLLFQYSRYHSVSEVDRAGYDACNTSDALLTGTGGNTTVPLTEPGDRFFVCGANELHCLGGMKLRVNVKVNSSAVAPAGESLPRKEAPSPALLHWDGRDSPFENGGGGGRGVAATARAACASVALSMCALWVFDQLLH